MSKTTGNREQGVYTKVRYSSYRRAGCYSVGLVVMALLNGGDALLSAMAVMRPLQIRETNPVLAAVLSHDGTVGLFLAKSAESLLIALVLVALYLLDVRRLAWLLLGLALVFCASVVALDAARLTPVIMR